MCSTLALLFIHQLIIHVYNKQIITKVVLSSYFTKTQKWSYDS